MEAAATFLGFNMRADSKKLYKNLALLSDRVILKIESLFESTCLDCGDKYSNDLADTPPLVCHLCPQGSHNCEKAKEKAKLSPRPSGLVWLCFDCFRKNDLALMTKDSGKVGQLENVTEEDEDEDEDESTEERISPRRNRSPHEKQAIICEAYKKRECRHGLTGKRLINGKPCPHKHPPRCFRWCKHGENKRSGCTKGEECTYFHPKLCKNSVLKRYCANRDCSFHHLKHTRRPRAQPPLETRRKTESKREESSSQPDPRFSSQPRAAPFLRGLVPGEHERGDCSPAIRQSGRNARIDPPFSEGTTANSDESTPSPTTTSVPDPTSGSSDDTPPEPNSPSTASTTVPSQFLSAAACPYLLTETARLGENNFGEQISAVG
ncbi:hypothetical protein ACHWQZ_G002380 [Mnemiopsis leidyi]